MSAVREIKSIRGMTMNGDQIQKAIATGLTASSEFCPVKGQELVVAYAVDNGQPVFQLMEIDPTNLEEGWTCFVQGALRSLHQNRHYFNSNASDVVKIFDVASSDLCKIILRHAPAISI